MKIFVRVLLVVFVIFFLFGITRSRAQFFVFGNPLEGKPAPEFTLPTLMNEAVTMSEYRNGQPALMFFWATWCPHCREALEDLNARAAEIETQGIKTILVDVGEARSGVESYLADHSITLDVFLDESSSVAQEYSLLGVPTFYLVNKEGIIKSVEHSLPENYTDILSSAN